MTTEVPPDMQPSEGEIALIEGVRDKSPVISEWVWLFFAAISLTYSNDRKSRVRPTVGILRSPSASSMFGVVVDKHIIRKGKQSRIKLGASSDCNLESPHVSWVASVLQTILITLEEAFQVVPKTKVEQDLNQVFWPVDNHGIWRRFVSIPTWFFITTSGTHDLVCE